jgi:phosphatidate cytidylyltransferase
MGAAAGSVVVSAMAGNPASAFWVVLSGCLAILFLNLTQAREALWRLIFGMIYIIFAIQVMVWVRNGSDYGLYNTLTLLAMVWASDSFAYFSGKLIGGPKLAPVISPKKTWAGFIGSSIGAGVVAALLTNYDLRQYLSSITIGHMTWIGYFIMGFILAMFGQAGDLLKSIFKRHYGIKDMGTLIPGHGGIMDRIDALLMVALVFGSLIFLFQ